MIRFSPVIPTEAELLIDLSRWREDVGHLEGSARLGSTQTHLGTSSIGSTAPFLVWTACGGRPSVRATH